MGILFAFIALASWGIGDFLLQRSTRKFGNWVALFYITAFAAVALLPFVWDELRGIGLYSKDFWILVAASAVMLVAALFNFQGLKIGKLSVIEPVYALEVLVTAALATFVLHESLGVAEYWLIAALITGIALVGIRSFHVFKGIHAEQGIRYALVGTIGMGTGNFLYGIGSRAMSPLLVNWFTSAVIAAACFLYLVARRRLGEVRAGLRHNNRLVFGVSIIDNFAWVAYSYSMLFIPIAIATSLSESYIALAALLGLVINREKLRPHQLIGLVLTVAAAALLAWRVGT